MSTSVADPELSAATDAALIRLEALLAADAVARDLAGGHAAAPRQAVRDSGLLGLSVPAALGGAGAPWPEVLQAVRRLARVDSALAHLFAFHHLQVASLLAWGSPAQQGGWLRATALRRLFWGNVLNPLDRGVLAVEHDGGGWWLDGRKGWASGARGADLLVVSAWHAASGTPLIGILDGDAPGLHNEGDWDAFGQRQTDSGAVRFEGVHLPAAAVLQAPGQAPTLFASVRTLLSQLIMAHLYLGIAEGALAEATTRLRTQGRPWFASGLARAVDDPYQQHRVAELHLQIRAAGLVTRAAARTLQATWERGPELTPAERGVLAIEAAEAKVLTHRAALAAGSGLFDLLGARATGRQEALDRFWRNARVHTLHDPVDYKLRDIGRHLLDDAWPEPTPYS